jgi:enamine deaminase RidA (YjgF/YER057c/UK114 family)
VGKTVYLSGQVAWDEKLDHSHHISGALKAFFPGAQTPATTWIDVRALGNKNFLIEIEATAVIE